tara:strand:- start:16823 stop:17104 length:282 start_codon:yes stop_codon:yes gene_type:complete
LQGITLTREITGATYYPQNDTNHFIGAVALTETLDNINDLNIYFVRQQILLDDCDILISVTSKNHVNKVEIPRLVNKLLKHIDCKLTFAFAID